MAEAFADRVRDEDSAPHRLALKTSSRPLSGTATGNRTEVDEMAALARNTFSRMAHAWTGLQYHPQYAPDGYAPNEHAAVIGEMGRHRTPGR